MTFSYMNSEKTQEIYIAKFYSQSSDKPKYEITKISNLNENTYGVIPEFIVVLLKRVFRIFPAFRIQGYVRLQPG